MSSDTYSDLFYFVNNQKVELFIRTFSLFSLLLKISYQRVKKKLFIFKIIPRKPENTYS
jgi:hypothetical protein